VPTVATARLAFIVVVAALASEAAATVPEVPADDIFGFTSPTDVGNPGETGFANENDGRVGKRGGSYRALNAKYELSHTPAPDWWVAASLFASHNHARDVPGFTDVNRTDFDGLSFEIERRIVKRTVGNPFAIAVSLEPRWGRVDAAVGLPAHFVNAAFKLFVDAVVVPDKVFWALNAIWVPQRAEDPLDRSRWLSSSGIALSTAIAYQWSPRFFLGAEVRYLGIFSTIFPTQEVGHAVYTGPTLWWKVTDTVAFNTTFQPQIAGRSIGNPQHRLDLDNFEKAQFRAKLTVAFQ